MKQDKSEKIIQKAERKAQKAAQQVEAANKKAEAAAQKEAVRAEKKAAKVAKAADKKAAKQGKRAEQATKKAQQAAQKAEEKKAKAVAKTAARATEEGEEGGKPKKGKKKLLILVAVAVVAAVGVGAFFFLRGGGEDEEAPLEPIEAPMEYVLNEMKITALPVWGEVTVYQEEIPPEPPAEPAPGEEGEAAEDSGDAESEAFTKILYRYEGLQAPGKLASAYMELMTTEDAGFSVVDETLLKIDAPEGLDEAASGSVQIARNVPEDNGGGVQSLLLSWDETVCTVTLDMPEGRVRSPQPEGGGASMAPSRGLSDLEAMDPAKLGLPGASMEEYELMVQEGSVRIAGSPCIRVNAYDAGSQIAGSFFLSSTGKLYKLDEETNKVVELDWE